MYQIAEFFSGLTADQVAAIAAVGTAAITLGAGGIALYQYWRTRSLSELEAKYRLYEQIKALADTYKIAAATKGYQRRARMESAALDFLEVSELYAASVLKGHLPKLTKEFITDFLKAELLQVIHQEPFASLIRPRREAPGSFKYVRAFAERYGHSVSLTVG